MPNPKPKNMKIAEAKNNYESKLNSWIESEKAAVELINVIGKLWFDKSVELIIFRNQLVDRSASEILNLHLYALNIIKQPINVQDTLLLAKEISNLRNIAPSRIDIGRLGAEWLVEKKLGISAAHFIEDKLNGFVGSEKKTIKPKDVVLYGFGRIGRLAARELVSQAGKGP